MKTEDGWLTSDQGLAIDMRSGTIKIEKKVRRLVEAIQGTSPTGRKKANRLKFERANPLSSEGILMDNEIAESVFNQLFMRTRDAKEYFLPILLNSQFYQLWKVEAESIAD